MVPGFWPTGGHQLEVALSSEWPRSAPAQGGGLCSQASRMISLVLGVSLQEGPFQGLSDLAFDYSKSTD